MDENDMLGRLRAEMDQARAGVREFAGMIWSFYDELCQQGFKADSALVLTLTFLSETMQNNNEESA